MRRRTTLVKGGVQPNRPRRGGAPVLCGDDDGDQGPAEGIAFAGASGTVRKTMTDTAPRKIAKLEVEIDSPGTSSAEARARLEAIARGSPVALSLAGDLPIPMLFRDPTQTP